LNIEWNSEEVRGMYPRTWNSSNFHHEYTEIEELIINRSHDKMVERLQTEKMMPRERVMRGFHGSDPDRIPFSSPFSPPVGSRIFDSFAETPPVVHNRDFIEFPELQILALSLWHARFISDFCVPITNTFGEELVTKKFRLIEHGPPLAVEPFAKTKEDMDWFMNNVPDPGHRGIFPLVTWTAKQTIKFLPELLTQGFCCAGPYAMATFFRGTSEFLIDIRKNYEMADLALQCVLKFFLKKLDRMMEAIGPVFNADTPDGNILFWCDGGGAYVTVDEFKKTWDRTYGTTIPYCAKKNVNPHICVIAAAAHNALVRDIMDEYLGGSLCCSDEVPPVEDFVPMWEGRNKEDNNGGKVFMIGGATTKSILKGEEATRKDYLRYARLLAAAPEKGLRAATSVVVDANTPLPSIDMAVKMTLEMFKYPVTV